MTAAATNLGASDDAFAEQVQTGDTALLTTDGVHVVLASETAAEACARLIETVEQAGMLDNAMAVVYRV